MELEEKQRHCWTWWNAVLTINTCRSNREKQPCFVCFQSKLSCYIVIYVIIKVVFGGFELLPTIPITALLLSFAAVATKKLDNTNDVTTVYTQTSHTIRLTSSDGCFADPLHKLATAVFHIYLILI